jgi:MFS family permease
VVCGLEFHCGVSVYSESLLFFALCRAMQGVGPALLLPNGIAILSRTFPAGRRKGMILSMFWGDCAGGFLCWGLPSPGSFRSCFGGLGLIGLWG